VEFTLSSSFQSELATSLNSDIPSSAICTRYYDGTLEISYDTSVSDEPVPSTQLLSALDDFAKAARRIPALNQEQEEQIQQIRTSLVNWVTEKKDVLTNIEELKNANEIQLLKKIRDEANTKSNPQTADIIEALQSTIESLLKSVQIEPIPDRLDAAIEDALPVFIYFDNYGILDSAVHLPRFLEDLKRLPDEPRIRTINAMFKHVKLNG
jgi:hypothetical protein